jgi:subtilisin family serine protease
MDPGKQSLGSFDPALLEAVREGDADQVVSLIIRITDPSSLPPDVRIVTLLGDIATVRIPLSRVAELANYESVVAMEASKRLRAPPNEYEGCHGGRDGIYSRRPEGVSGTGRKVIVGVLDFGFDFAHSAFRNEDGSTRILALWDQRGASEEDPANRWGYGRIFTSEDINQALSHPDPYGALGYNPSDSDSIDSRSGAPAGAHGTHVLDIAAGNGRDGGLSGVAPEADLVCVQLWRTNPVLGPGNFGDSATVLEGVDFIFSTAGDRPCVVNMSMGAHGGPHDSTTLVEQGIDAAVWLQPGRAVVCSAGNYFDRRMHAEGRVVQGKEFVLPFMVPERDPTESEIEIYYESSDRFIASVADPSGTVIATVAPQENQPMIVSTKTAGHVYHYLREPTSDDHHIDIFFRPYAPGGKWELRLRGERVSDGRFHAWIERDRGLSPWFLRPYVTQTSTTGTICNGRYSITVGAYDPFDPNRPIGSFSSAGPTRDGRFKPELVAPGVNIRAAKSTPRGEPPGPRYVCKDGTSMAAPHVTGAVAVLFEAAGAPLPITDTRAILFTTAERVQPETVDPIDLHRVGYGYLDLAEAEAAARMWRRANVRSDDVAAEISETDRIPEVGIHESIAGDSPAAKAASVCAAHGGGVMVHNDEPAAATAPAYGSESAVDDPVSAEFGEATRFGSADATGMPADDAEWSGDESVLAEFDERLGSVDSTGTESAEFGEAIRFGSADATGMPADDAEWSGDESVLAEFDERLGSVDSTGTESAEFGEATRFGSADATGMPADDAEWSGDESVLAEFDERLGSLDSAGTESAEFGEATRFGSADATGMPADDAEWSGDESVLAEFDERLHSLDSPGTDSVEFGEATYHGDGERTGIAANGRDRDSRTVEWGESEALDVPNRYGEISCGTPLACDSYSPIYVTEVAGCAPGQVPDPKRKALHPQVFRELKNPSVGRAQQLLNRFLARAASPTFCRDQSTAALAFISTGLATLRAQRQNPLVVDCEFSRSTELATKMFQTCMKINPDGVVGAEVWALLELLDPANGAPFSARPCCILAPDNAAIGTNILNPAAIGTHGGPSEQNGQLYCGAAGFVDLGHARDMIDLTKIIHDKLTAAGGPPQVIRTVLGIVSIRRTPANPAETAASIAFDDALGHEIVSWDSRFPGGRNSSFSPEDLVSNFLGTHVARKAMARVTASGGTFGAAATTELNNMLTSLTVQSKPASEVAFNRINSRWVTFTSALSLSSDRYLLRRNFTRTPFKTGHPSDTATPAFVTAAFSTNVRDDYDYFHLEGGRVLAKSKFDVETARVRLEAKAEFGSDFDKP